MVRDKKTAIAVNLSVSIEFVSIFCQYDRIEA